MGDELKLAVRAWWAAREHEVSCSDCYDMALGECGQGAVLEQALVAAMNDALPVAAEES